MYKDATSCTFLLLFFAVTLCCIATLETFRSLRKQCVRTVMTEQLKVLEDSPELKGWRVYYSHFFSPKNTMPALQGSDDYMYSTCIILNKS